jgi:hypothetical protein
MLAVILNPLRLKEFWRCVVKPLVKIRTDVGVFCSRRRVSVTLDLGRMPLSCCFGSSAEAEAWVDTGDWSEVKTIRPQGVALFVASVGSWDRNVPDLRRGAPGSKLSADSGC